MFDRHFIHFDFGFKEKLENEPWFEKDIVLNFAMCFFINLCDPIHDQVSVLLIIWLALKKFTYPSIQFCSQSGNYIRSYI